MTFEKSRSIQLQFTEDLRSSSPYSTPLSKYQLNPEFLGSFLSSSINFNVMRLNNYQKGALIFLNQREDHQEQLFCYVPAQQIDFQIQLLIKSHFSLHMSDMALSIGIPIFLKTSKLNESKQDLALRILTILHIADKFDPNIMTIRLKEKIIKLFGTSCDKISVQNIKQIEKQILEEIDYDINWVQPYIFLQQYVELSKISGKYIQLAKYLVFTAMCQPDLYQQRPSIICLACVCIALKMQFGFCYSENLRFWTGYSKDSVEIIVQQILQLAQKQYMVGIQGQPSILFKLFSQPKYGAVSLIMVQ